MPPLPFSGAARPMAATDFRTVANLLNCDLATVKAVCVVETGGCGGFLSDGSGRPRILFEAHVFSRLTNHNFDSSHPDISSLTWNRKLYAGGAAEYLRLAKALQLDRAAALKAASWGMFQVLGENHKLCGFDDVEAFVQTQANSEVGQAVAFAEFLQNTGLDKPLRALDWETFARGYNGPRFAENAYDRKLATAYADANGTHEPEPTVLRIGSRGPAVQRLQLALNRYGADLAADGVFGRVTEIAVEKFQDGHGLAADGVVGPKTAAALGVA